MTTADATATPPLDAAPTLTSLRSLDRTLLRGIAWTGGAKWLTQLISWIATLWIAHILSPQDYGLVGMATLYLGLISMLGEFGVGTTVVAMQDVTEEVFAQAHGFSTVLGVAAVLASVAAAVPLSRFFSTPALESVVLVLSAGALLAALRTVPYARLQRDLRFGTIAVVDATQGLLLASTTLGLALAGATYWSLVFGALVSGGVSTVIVLLVTRQRMAAPTRLTLEGFVSFSRRVIGSRLCWYVYSNADFLVAARLLGQTALGHYTFAWNIAGGPAEKLTSLVAGVTPSVFASARAEPGALGRYFLRVTAGLSMLTFPAALGLAVVADDLVTALLGPKWLEMVLPLRLLAVYASVRSVSPLLSQVLYVTGHERFVLRNTIAAVLALPLAFVAGSRWGVTGIAAAWLIVHPFVLAPMLRRALRSAELSLRQYALALLPAMTGSLAMVAAVLLAEQLLPVSVSPMTRLVVQVVTGAASYTAAMAILFPDRLRSVRALRRGAFV